MKYDTDKTEYQDKSGYVEGQQLRVHNEGTMLNYVQILCVKAYKGERSPAKVSAFLDGEWKYVSRYLNFIISYYKLNEIGMVGGLQKKRIETVRRDVLDAMDKLEKVKKDDDKIDKANENQDNQNTVEETTGPSSSKKRKIASKKEKVPKPMKASSKSSIMVMDVDNSDHDSDKENKPPNNSASEDKTANGVANEIIKSVNAAIAKSTAGDYENENANQNNKDPNASEDETESLGCDEEQHTQFY